MFFMKAASGLGLAALVYVGTGASLKPATPPVVTITARDYSYDPIKDIPSGVVEIRLHNLGSTYHHAAFFKLDSGKTEADVVSALKNPGPPPSWLTPVAGPNAPKIGGFSNEIVDLTPGNYVALCFVDTNGGVPHFMKGMIRGFKVVPSNNHAKEPKPDIHIEAFDYNYKFSKPVTAGMHTFHVMNTATQPHEIQLFELAPGKTMSELVTWLSGPMTSAPPIKQPWGGIVNLPPGQHAIFRANLPKGEYVAICFQPDAKDGKPHFMHGMELQFSVK